jgi:hypothetical protein
MTREPGAALAAPIEAGDWDEPRGPHLPDFLVRMRAPAWIAVIAVARGIWYIRDVQLGPSPDLSMICWFVVGLATAVIPILLPAAVLLRHPDAFARARPLLVGASLLAIAEGLRLVGGSLRPLFEQLTPPDAETAFLVPLDLIYSTLSELIAVAGIAGIGVGLARARRYEDQPGSRPIVGLLVLVVTLTALARVAFVLQNPLVDVPTTPTVIGYYLSVFVLGVLPVVAWGYLAVTLVRGARVPEVPGLGWMVGAFGAFLMLVGLLLNTAITIVRPTADTQAMFSTIGLVAFGVFALGYLGLLAALLLGLPSLDEAEPAV